MAGIGFDAQVSKEFAKSSKRGWFNYLKIILKLTMNAPCFNVHLEFEGKTKDAEVCMISIANSSQYGNNTRIAPDADIRDGKFDICILKNTKKIKMISLLIRSVIGKVKTNEYFRIVKTKEMKIVGNDGWAHVDGEPIKVENEIIIENKPLSLKVIYPS